MKQVLIFLIIVVVLVFAWKVISDRNRAMKDAEYVYIDTEPMETYVPEEESYLDEMNEAREQSFRPSISLEGQI
jgi:uncharacterized protein YxeA